MSRTIESINDEISLVTEETGEQWKTMYERSIPDPGYCLFQGIPYPILTPQQITDTVLPHFDIERYTEQPKDNEQLFSFLCHSLNLNGRSILERVARIRIREQLKTITGDK